MAQTVIGFFENNLAAYKAVAGLTSRGISTNQIDITREEGTDTTNAAHKREGESGFTRFFKNLFGDNEEAERYSSVSRSGCTMVTVHAQSADEASFAANLLDDFGAIDVDERAGRTGYEDRSRQQRDTNQHTHREETRQSMQDDGEQNRYSNRRMRSRIVEKPVEENVRLREEHIRIERNPVDRAASEQDLQSFQEGAIELTERKEVPIVNKEARVVEEIRLRKEVEERDQTIHEKLRRNEVDINRMDKNRDDYSDTRSFDNRRTDGSSNSHFGNDVNEDDSDYNRRDKRDGDPLFGV